MTFLEVVAVDVVASRDRARGKGRSSSSSNLSSSRHPTTTSSSRLAEVAVEEEDAAAEVVAVAVVVAAAEDVDVVALLEPKLVQGPVHQSRFGGTVKEAHRPQ